MSENVTWSFFVDLKLTLFSQKMKIWNHTILVNNERFVVPKIPLILCKTVKNNTRAVVFKKNYGSGGRTEIFLKSHNRAHTCRIEKRFSVVCSSSDALSDKIYFWRKSKNPVFSILVTSGSVTSQSLLLTKKIQKKFSVINRSSSSKSR